MEKDNFLVFLKNKKTDKFFHATTKIKKISEQNNGFAVTFKDERTYIYGKDKVLLYPFIKSEENLQVYDNGLLLSAYNHLDDYGKYVVLWNDKKRDEPRLKSQLYIDKNQQIKKQALSVLDYFKAIIDQNTIQRFEIPTGDAENEKKETENIKKILTYGLKNINTKCSFSVLSHYVEKRLSTNTTDCHQLIFPFGCNESQKKAVKVSLSNNINVIEGPPGTGKTQTILNLTANLIMQNKTVGIVSNNNSAVSNVQEKLQKHNYGIFLAALGNQNNREAFFNIPPKEFTEKAWELTSRSRNKARTRLKELSILIENLFQSETQLALLKTNLSDAQTEMKHLQKASTLTDSKITFLDRLFFRKWNSRKALHFKMFITDKLYKESLLSISTKAQLLLQYGVWKQKVLLQNKDTLSMYANHLFYKLFIAELNSQIENLEKWLQSQNKQEITNEYIQLSKALFNDKLSSKYNCMQKKIFTSKTYKYEFQAFKERYPVILSTTYSLKSSLPANYLLDYVIIDESSQVDIITASLCFSCCRNAIIIGDSRQLSHIVDNQKKNVSQALRHKYEVDDSYDYVNRNILSSLKSIYGPKLPTVMLREHYRCHPLIIGYCNRKFYNDELIIMTRGTENPFKIIETNIGGEHGRCNQRQIDTTKEYLLSLNRESYTDIGIISPYTDHKQLLQQQLTNEIEIDTIHKFQGREKNTIIFNTVRNQLNDFIDNPCLINVAVSRAINKLVIVKSCSMKMPHGSNIGDLVRYICYMTNPDETIIHSNIRSVFDILYKEYWKEKQSYLNKISNRDGSIAENIIYDLLLKIRANNSLFETIKIVREYPLSDLIKDYNHFSLEEITYIKHRARLDFLLYNRIDNSPILAIEVDGVTYHRFNKEQTRRDKHKDHILNCIGLPLLRLSTDGHDEEKQIINSLKEAMGRFNDIK